MNREATAAEPEGACQVRADVAPSPFRGIRRNERQNQALMLAVEETIGPLQIATAVVAGYAALVATLALGFNVFQWLKSWQTQVDVELRRMTSMDREGGTEPVILFRLVNHSGHKVTITHVGMTPLKRGGRHIFIPHPLPLPTAGPFDIPPRDAVTVYIQPDRLKDYDPKWKTRAQVTTSDRRDFCSKKVRVTDLVRD